MADVEAPQLKVLQECGFKDEQEFAQRGSQALELLRGLGALEEGTIVELGCAGHVAAALKPHAKGIQYHGIGLSAPMLKWCGGLAENGTFAFQRLDVRDAQRNPNGAVLPEKVRLPFDDETVDVVYAESLFTTMSQEALRRYIGEIARILKPGGRFVGTFFLLDGPIMVRISQRRTRYTFEHRIDTYCRGQKKNEPGTPIAYNDSFIRMLGAPARLEVKEMRPGSWSSADGATIFEDLVIAEKLPAEEEAPAEPEQEAKTEPKPEPKPKLEPKPEPKPAPQAEAPKVAEPKAPAQRAPEGPPPGESVQPPAQV